MRRKPIAVVVALAGLVTAGVVGAGVSGAQYGPYPPSATQTSTSPSYTTPTTTSTTPAPAPTRKRAKNTVGIKGTSIADYRFSPRTLKIKRGKRVKWSWNSNAPHNVKFSRLHKKSRTVKRGSFRLRFKERGTYRYLCTVHGFTGKVVVR
jgi:plastocyanin